MSKFYLVEYELYKSFPPLVIAEGSYWKLYWLCVQWLKEQPGYIAYKWFSLSKNRAEVHYIYSSKWNIATVRQILKKGEELDG